MKKEECAFVVRYFPAAPVSEAGSVVSVTEIESFTSKPATKRRTSRAKAPVKGSKKKTMAKSEMDPDEYQNMIFSTGEIGEDMLEPKKPGRGKKRASSVMEEGSKRPLFSQDAINAKVLERQQQYREDQESVKPPPPKRRVTRASISQQPELDLFVSVPNHLALGDEEVMASISLHNTPAKSKTKPKKATRSSTTSTKGRGKKVSAAKQPFDFAGMDDDEIDKALELDLMKDVADGEEPLMLSVPARDSLLEELEQESFSPEPVEQPNTKGKRRLTRTKPAEPSSPTPEPAVVPQREVEGQEQKLTKPTKKRTARTKQSSRTTNEIPHTPAVVSPMVVPVPTNLQPRSSVPDRDDEVLDTPKSESLEEAGEADERSTSHERDAMQEKVITALDKEAPLELSFVSTPMATPRAVTPAQKAVPRVSSIKPSEAANIPLTNSPISPVRDGKEEVEVVDESTKENAPRRGRPSRKRGSGAPLAESARDKSNKRKSEVLIDENENEPIGKKRKVSRKIKKGTSIKQKEASGAVTQIKALGKEAGPADKDVSISTIHMDQLFTEAEAVSSTKSQIKSKYQSIGRTERGDTSVTGSTLR